MSLLFIDTQFRERKRYRHKNTGVKTIKVIQLKDKWSRLADLMKSFGTQAPPMGRCQVEIWVATFLQSSWQEGNGSMRETMTQGPGKEMAHITSSQIPSALSQSCDPTSMQGR